MAFREQEKVKHKKLFIVFRYLTKRGSDNAKLERVVSHVFKIGGIFFLKFS